MSFLSFLCDDINKGKLALQVFLSCHGIRRMNMQAYSSGSLPAQKTRPDIRAGEQA